MSQAKGASDLPLIHETIAQIFATTCAANGPKLAVHFPQEGVHFTFAKLLTEVEKLATGLRVSGLQIGDHVLLWGANYANMLVSIYACCRAGLIFSCLNPALSKNALLKSLAMGDFRAVICFPGAHPGESYRTLAELCPELRNSAKGHLSSKTLVKLTHVIMAEEDHKYAGTFTLSEIFGKGTLEELKKIGHPPGDPNAVATIQFSMGTTGEPKPVLLNHFQLLNSCLVTGKRLKLDTPDQVLCCPMPIFRGPVMCMAAMATAVFGTRVVYPSALPLPPAIFKSVQEYKCTCLISNPIAFHLMLRLPAVKNFDLSSLKTVCFVGEHIPQDLIASMRRLTSITQVTVGVFLTEAGCMPIMSLPETPPESLLRTQGQVADHFEVKLLGLDGAIAPRGQIGEICVRPIANSEFLGYYKENELSRSFFVHGWILTGDVGVMDAAGNVQVLGQKQDVIFPSSDGTKTSPILPWTIERKLATHPDLIGVQIVGVPAASGKTKTCAIVVLKTKNDHAVNQGQVKADLIEMCRQEKLVEPDYVVFVTDFPRTHTKKVQKFKLREMVLSLIKENPKA